MRYVKKTCILREIRSGFTLDGKPLTGMIKLEQYGSNLSAELAFTNLSPTTEGSYHCLLADSLRRYKVLSLDEGARFSFSSEMEVSAGFYAALCFVKEKASPIAVGSCGKLSYDLFALVREAFSEPNEQEKEQLNTDMPHTNPIFAPPLEAHYNDELVADENYYEQESNHHEQSPIVQTEQNAPLEGGNSHQGKEERHHPATNENHESVCHAFTTQTDGYYQSVKGELNALFERYPKDTSLCQAYSHSEWVRVKGEENSPKELVGLIYENGIVKYICYALPATEDTPQEIRERGYFVPISALTPEKGFFVLYQSASTGESILKN
jgi:hypothetical protein